MTVYNDPLCPQCIVYKVGNLTIHRSVSGWVVNDNGLVLQCAPGKNPVWVYEPFPSSIDEHHIRTTRFDFYVALDLATKHQRKDM